MEFSFLVLLRTQFANPEGFVLTDHARKRRAERDISIFDISNCVLLGQIIEEQNHGKDPIILIRGPKLNGTIMHLAIALTENKPVIITVCYSDENIWEMITGLVSRKIKKYKEDSI